MRLDRCRDPEAPPAPRADDLVAAADGRLGPGHADRAARPARCQPGHHGPAGGRTNLETYVFLLGAARHGGGDPDRLRRRHAGRQQRRLPRPRRHRPPARDALRRSRPGRAGVFLPMLAVGSCSRSRAAYVFAGDRADRRRARRVAHASPTSSRSRPSTSILAIGLAAFTSSRVVVGVLIAWNAIVSHLLISIHALGGARKLHRRRGGASISRLAINDDDQVVDVGSDRAARAARLGRCVFQAAAAGGPSAATPDERPTSRRGTSCEPARSSSAPSRRRRGRCGPSRARSRGAPRRAPSGRSARPGGSTFPPG